MSVKQNQQQLSRPTLASRLNGRFSNIPKISRLEESAPNRRKKLKRRMLLETLDRRELMAADVGLYGSVTFDFGTDQSPVELGSVQMSNAIRYSSERGYGLLSEANAVDRGQADDLNRDFVAAKKISFRFDVPNGLYQVEPGLGDRTRLRDRIQVAINGEVRDVVTTLGATPVVPSYFIEVTDGSIVLEVTDLGGDSQNAALTSLAVTALDSSYGIPEDRPADAVNQSPLLVIATHGRVSPSSQGKLLSTSDKLDRPDVTEWVFELPRALAKATRGDSLDILNPNVRPVLLPKIEAAQTEEELLALHKGSEDIIALNWTKESSFGTPQNAGDILDGPGDVYNEVEHRKAVTRASVAIFRMLEARIRSELAENPSAKVDLLIVGHSFGATANREVVMMLNQSELADHVDFVKVVELDPVAMKADENPSERADSHDRYFWKHPTSARNGRPIVDSVVNYYQTEGLAFTGILEKGLIMGLPLDGQDGGGILGFKNGEANVFDTITGETADRFKNLRNADGKPTDGDLRAGVYSPDGKVLAIASEDGSLRIREADTHNEIRTIRVSKSTVTDISFLPESDKVVTVSKDGKIRVFRVADGEKLWEGEHKGNAERQPDGTYAYRGAKVVALSSDGKLMVTGGTGDHIKIWMRESGPDLKFRHVQSLPSHRGETTSIAFASDGTLVTGGTDGKIRRWKQGSSVYELSQELALNADVRQAVFSDDGRFLAVAAGRSVSLYMKAQDGSLIRTREFRDHVDAVYGLAFTKDGTRLATGGLDRTIFIYDAASGNKVNVLNQAMLGVRTLAYNSDGNRLLATFFDSKGGPVKDINVTEQVRSRVGFIENISSGGSAHHSEVPFVYIDLVIRKTNDSFFEMRDKPRASRYGDFEAGDLTKWDADSIATDEVFGNSDEDLSLPWLDELTNLHAPVFNQSIQTTIVPQEMEISLAGLAVDPDGNAITWSVRSSSPQTIVATINGNSLRLRPLKEGSSEIELTANDGRWAAQVRFAAKADGTAWRDKAAQLKGEAHLASAELDAIQRQIDRVNKELSAINEEWSEIDDKVDQLQKNVGILRKELADSTLRVDRLQQERNSVLAAKSAADAALVSAEAAFRTSSSNYSRLDSQTSQLFQTYQQRQNARQVAKQRLDNANKMTRPARLAEFNSAVAAAAQAENAWRTSQSQRDAAGRTMDASRRLRDNSASEAARQSTRLVQVDGELKRAISEKSAAETALNEKLRFRDVLLSDLGKLQTRNHAMRTHHESLRNDLSAVTTKLQVLTQTLVSFQQNKWVDNLGLEKIEEGQLSPASNRIPRLGTGLSEVSDRINRIEGKILDSSNRLSSLG